MSSAAPHGIPGHLVGFVESLRARGIPVGPSETVDAGQVVSVLDLLDREALREGLACALLRRPTHRPTFDGLFDLWFPSGIGERISDDADVEVPRSRDGTVDLDALRNLIAEMIAQDARQQQRALVALMVEQLGQYQSANGPSFSAYQTLRDVQPESLLAKVLAGIAGGTPDTGAEPPDDDAVGTEVARRLARARIANFRTQIEAETRRRSAERLGKDRVAKYGVPKQAEDVEFLRATDAEMAQLRRSVQALARLLASRLAVRRHRARRGEFDLRKTLRKSMSTGGVPIDLARRRPRLGRPELVILCDVSGSVSGFSHFTLLLVSALREQFSRVRIFAFVDSADEVTEHFAPGADLGGAMARIFAEADIVRYDGHSDYGNAFEVFAKNWGDAVTSKTSLLVLGDGRNNYRDPRLETLRTLVRTAKHAHWLNPERRSQWDTGDSAAAQYQQVIRMHECRSAKQLTAVVASAAAPHVRA